MLQAQKGTPDIGDRIERNCPPDLRINNFNASKLTKQAPR